MRLNAGRRTSGPRPHPARKASPTRVCASEADPRALSRPGVRACEAQRSRGEQEQWRGQSPALLGQGQASRAEQRVRAPEAAATRGAAVSRRWKCSKTARGQRLIPSNTRRGATQQPLPAATSHADSGPTQASSRVAPGPLCTLPCPGASLRDLGADATRGAPQETGPPGRRGQSSKSPGAGPAWGSARLCAAGGGRTSQLPRARRVGAAPLTSDPPLLPVLDSVQLAPGRSRREAPRGEDRPTRTASLLVAPSAGGAASTAPTKCVCQEQGAVSGGVQVPPTPKGALCGARTWGAGPTLRPFSRDRRCREAGEEAAAHPRPARPHALRPPDPRGTRPRCGDPGLRPWPRGAALRRSLGRSR